MQTAAHDFRPRDFVAGHVALDFTNTVTARDTRPLDWLDGYARLIEWARLAGLIDARTLSRLSAIAIAEPREAAGALGRGRRLREALHDACVALLARRSPPREVSADIEAAWRRAAGRARLSAHDGKLHLDPDEQASGLDLPLDLVVFAAVDLLGELDTDRTRVCRGHDCGWLFIDTSKSGRRVWCDMGTCGNTEKSRRFARAGKRRRRAG